MKILKISILFILFSVKAYAQVSPNEPILKNVTVIQGSGNVEITWELTDSADLVIYRDDIESHSYIRIDIISDTSINSYIDNNSFADTIARSYRIAAELNGDVLHSSFSDTLNTIYTTCEFDSCAQEIPIAWTKYINSDFEGDDVEIKNYNIYKSVNNGPFELIATTTLKEYIDTDIEENTDYKYYIEAVLQYDTSIKSKSNVTNIYTSTLQSPDSIHADYIKSQENGFDLKFTIADNSELEKYKLLRAIEKNGMYDTIETVITNENEIYFSDTHVTSDENIYYYKLAALNGCNLVSTISDTINNIVLNVSNNNFINTLSWNKYKEESNKIISYKIYRKIGDELPQSIIDNYHGNTYNDNISNMQLQASSESPNSGKFCYYVRAFEEEYLSNYSESNTSCVYYKPKVFVPSAFTPNGDGDNDEFKIFFSFLPIDYKLQIYNRWGNLIFETNEPLHFWDGRTSQNTKVKMGTYIYYLKIKTPKNEIVEKKGNVIVFYP
ncbi:MAG: gliding motility-associated C-terminal domain-containing protein [Bacteroidota bacterium]|nr:gliding motility-associated C-terminal domain-containing protein [Bacteroidota bacterium]